MKGKKMLYEGNKNLRSKSGFVRTLLVMSIMLFGLISIIAMTGIVSAGSYDYGTTTATLLNQDPDPAEPGKYVELRWKVVKSGNNVLKDIRYELLLDYPFSFITDDTPIRELGDWGGNPQDEEYVTLYYKLKVADDALEDDYKVRLKYTTSGQSDGVLYEYDIRVGEKQEPNFELGTLVTAPTKLVADTDEAELQIEIENVGDGDAEHVKTELKLPDGFSATYSYSDRKNLGTIEAGEGKTATYYVDIDEDVKGGTYQSTVEVTYKDANEDEFRTVILPLDIQVKDKPQFEIESIETNPEKVYPGSSVEVKFDIKNIGGQEGESMSIRGFKDSSQPIEFTEKSDYVGKLMPDETGEAILKLDVDDEADPKTYIIDLEIRAIDGDEVLIIDKSMKLKVESPNQGTLSDIKDARENAGFMVRFGIPMALILIGLLIGFFIGKGRKEKSVKVKKK